MALKGGTCAGNNPTGLTYEVLDNYIINPSVGLGAGFSKGAGSDDTKAGSTAVAASSSPVAVTSATRAVITSAQPVAVTSAQQAVTSPELAATTDTAVRSSFRYSFSTVVQDADISPSATSDIVLVAVQSPGCTESSAVDAAETSRTSTCTFGAWQCSGLELQVCNYLTVDSLDKLFYIYGEPGR